MSDYIPRCHRCMDLLTKEKWWKLPECNIQHTALLGRPCDNCEGRPCVVPRHLKHTLELQHKATGPFVDPSRPGYKAPVAPAVPGSTSNRNTLRKALHGERKQHIRKEAQMQQQIHTEREQHNREMAQAQASNQRHVAQLQNTNQQALDRLNSEKARLLKELERTKSRHGSAQGTLSKEYQNEIKNLEDQIAQLHETHAKDLQNAQEDREKAKKEGMVLQYQNQTRAHIEYGRLQRQSAMQRQAALPQYQPPSAPGFPHPPSAMTAPGPPNAAMAAPAHQPDPAYAMHPVMPAQHGTQGAPARAPAQYPSPFAHPAPAPSPSPVSGSKGQAGGQSNERET